MIDQPAKRQKNTIPGGGVVCSTRSTCFFILFLRVIYLFIYFVTSELLFYLFTKYLFIFVVIYLYEKLYFLILFLFLSVVIYLFIYFCISVFIYLFIYFYFSVFIISIVIILCFLLLDTLSFLGDDAGGSSGARFGHHGLQVRTSGLLRGNRGHDG